MVKNMLLSCVGREVKGSLLVMTMVLLNLSVIGFTYWSVDYQGMLDTYRIINMKRTYDTENELILSVIRQDGQMAASYEVDGHHVRTGFAGATGIALIHEGKSGRMLSHRSYSDRYIKTAKFR